MNDDTTLIAYLEARRTRRNRVVAAVVGIVLAIAAIAGGIYIAGADERKHNSEVNEYLG